MQFDRVCAELAEAERYREAYGQLVEEVDALVARHALAEEEARKLSKFNAEIVGHNNPAQRIVYVDRIRRELHETKQVSAPAELAYPETRAEWFFCAATLDAHARSRCDAGA